MQFIEDESACSKIHFYQNIFLPKHIYSKTYFQQNIFLAKHISTKTYFYQIIFLAKHIPSKTYFQQNIFLTIALMFAQHKSWWWAISFRDQSHHLIHKETIKSSPWIIIDREHKLMWNLKTMHYGASSVVNWKLRNCPK